MSCYEFLVLSKPRRNIYDKALEKWGYDKQLLMVVEECGELLSVLGKENRRRVAYCDVITELADVSIMVEQMAQYFGWDEFQKERVQKLKRLEERLKNFEES